MGNSRVLQKATKELTKAKAPKKSKDIIYDPAGQWKFPGQNTRIPGGNITMQGVPYPVYAQPNVGQPQMMYPGQDYVFPGADYVDEQPQMKKGGRPRGLVSMPKPSKKGLASKAYSRSLDATNKLFTENNLFKKPKDKRRKVFDPNAKYYAEGGSAGCPKGFYYNGKKCVKLPKNVFITSDPDEYKQRIQAYRDSSITHQNVNKYNRALQNVIKGALATGSSNVHDPYYITGLTTSYGFSSEDAAKKHTRKTEAQANKLKTRLFENIIDNSGYYTPQTGREIALHDHHPPVKGKSGFINSIDNDYQYYKFPAPKQPVVFAKEYPKEEVKKQLPKKTLPKKTLPNKEEPVYEDMPEVGRLPIKQALIDQPKGTIITQTNTTPEEVVEKTDVEYTPEYSEEGGPDSVGYHYKDKQKRYIDWNGRAVGYRPLKFRKPGHSGELIKLGGKKYFYLPTIESRTEDWFVPDNDNEEEYQDGGEYGMPLGTGVSQNFIGNRDEFKVGGIPELPLRDNQVNYDAYVNRFEPKTRMQDGGEQDAMSAMMKARLAYANEFGNPAAQRMINLPDNPYQFDDGNTGTHYMASMDNYAVPQIQDINGQLMLGDYGPESNEAIRFDTDDDANYFAEHYKDVSPGFIEAELTDDEIEEYRKGGYIVEDISIPSLNQYDKGGRFKRRKKKQEEQEQLEYRPPVEVNDEMYESVTPFPEAPEEFKQGVGNIKEIEKKAQAPDWLKFSNEYEKKNSKQAFIDEKKKEYLKGTNQGLLKAQGYNMENFPEDVERNFEKAYDYKKNSFIVKKLGKKEKFSPNRRGEWVDELSKKEKEIVANSKYESKLQPSYWSRTLAGLQELYGDVYAPGVSSRIPIAGLTKKEQKDIQNSKLGAFETLAGWDALGAVAANALEQSGNSGYGASYRESPGILSGEKMAGVTDEHAMTLNLLNYTLPYDIAAAAPSIIKGVGNVANVTKTVGKNLIQASPLKKAYKYNPWAFKADKEAAYRMLGGKEGYLDAVESGLLRPNQKTGRYDATFYNVGEPLDRYKAGYDTQYMAEVPLSNEKIYPRYEGADDYRISEEIGAEAFDTRVPKGHVGIYEPGVNLYKEHWLQGYKKVKPPKATKKLEVVPSEEELIDLWRIQEKGDRPMAELAAEGKLGPMFKNEKAIQHFKDREKYFGQWFTKDKADLDWYKTDREFKDPEIINLKVPKSKLEEFQNYDKTLSRASDREFVIPQEEQGLYKVSETPKELPGSSNKSFMGKVKDYFDRPPGPLMLGMSKGAVFTKEIKNPDYFLDLMKINKYSAKNKKYFEDLIATVKRQGNVASERQYDELQRLKTGDMNYGKKGFAKGGIVSELSNKEIKDLVAQGYIVKDVD